MPVYDLYGFANVDIKAAQFSVERALATEFVASYSTYHCGDYYRSDLGAIEELILQLNYDATEQEWTEETFHNYHVILYITTATIARADEIKRLLVLQVPAPTHLQRDIA